MICKSCGSKLNKNSIKFGLNPKSNDYLKKKIYKNKFYDLAITDCNSCNLIQIIDPIFYKDITPHYNWIINKEEDKHHSKVVKLILNKKLLKKNSKILGFSQYDQTLINELNKNNFRKTRILNLKEDCGIEDNNLRQEVVQNYLNKEISEIVVNKYGKFDVLICCKLLEHTQNIDNFFDFAKGLLNKSGIFIIDVPDCEKSLIQGNISMIWEEHIFYFVKKTLISTFQLHGFKKKNFFVFPYKQENALIGIFKLKSTKKISYKKDKLFENYKKKLIKYKYKINNILKKYKKVIIFGAGHNSVIFINLFKISKYISFIVDDDSNKKNMFIPKALIKILPSSFLNTSKLKICLLATNPSSENKIINNYSLFLKNNGKFFSIYPDSKKFLLKKQIR